MGDANEEELNIDDDFPARSAQSRKSKAPEEAPSSIKGDEESVSSTSSESEEEQNAKNDEEIDIDSSARQSSSSAPRHTHDAEKHKTHEDQPSPEAVACAHPSGDEQRGGEGDGDDAGPSSCEHNAPSMSSKQQRLFALRLKLNDARKKNYKEVVAEDKRKNMTPEQLEKLRLRELRDKRVAEKHVAEGGEDDEGEKYYMSETAEKAQQREEKRKKKGKSELFTQDSLWRSYKKRTTGIAVNVDEYEQQKAQLGDAMFPDTYSMNYGQTPTVTRRNIDKMVNELEQQAQKREKFSRRRAFNEDADVDHINERNAVFNKKVARFYDKYTGEIKANLERGSALP